jgi:hypothetical protein
VLFSSHPVTYVHLEHNHVDYRSENVVILQAMYKPKIPEIHKESIIQLN